MTDTTALSSPVEPSFGDYVTLLKPRVMSLVIFTAMVGLLVAPVPVHPMVGFASILFIAIGAGASGALNMWWDADIDRIMTRTRNRPVPAGRVTREEALALGLALSGVAVVMLILSANLVAGLLLALTIFYYVVIYTIWLKRWTPQNIVIGGAAGSFPPMIGWAAATGTVSYEAVLMFLVIFIWTPPHFWALALFMKSDYREAGVPMLTVTHGHDATRRQIFIYTVVLAPVCLALGLSPIGGPVTLTAVVVLNAMFLRGAWKIRRRTTEQALADNYQVERRVFAFSILYLFLQFLALLGDAGLRAFHLGGWGWL